MSVGSIAAACSVTVWACAFHWGSVPAIAFALAVSVMVVFAHRANIKRLLAHEEPSFSLGKSLKEKAAQSGGEQA